MVVSPSVTSIADATDLAMSKGRSIRPVPKPKDRPLVANGDPLAYQIVAIESDAIEASCELVYQRGDLDEFGRLDLDRDALLDAIECAVQRGDAAAALYLVRQAKAIDRDCDAAVGRATERRANAHRYTQSAAGRVERIMTGRPLDACAVLEQPTRCDFAAGLELVDAGGEG